MKAHSCCGSHHKGGDFDASGKTCRFGSLFARGLPYSALRLAVPVLPLYRSLVDSRVPLFRPDFLLAFRGLFVDKKINTSMLVSLAMIASFGLQIMGIFGVNVSADTTKAIFLSLEKSLS